MGWLESLISGGASGILGSVIGLFGSGVTAYFTHKTRKLDIEQAQINNAHEIAMAEQNRETLRAEAEANIRAEQVKIEGAETLAELEALKTSYSELNTNLFDNSYLKLVADSKWIGWLAVPFIGIVFAMVDVMRRMARPLLTYYLMGITTWVTVISYSAYMALPRTGDEALWAGLLEQIINTIILLTVSSVTWWFADRRMAKSIARSSMGPGA